LIIEEVPGQKFEDFMQRNILIPLGMKSSTFEQMDGIPDKKAVPYNGDGDNIPDRKFRAAAAAGFQSSLKDMIKFATTELNRSDSSKIISDESLLLMDKVSEPAKFYGLGHQIRTYNGITVIGHVGSNKGWTAHYEVIPALGDGIIILTNSNAGFFVHNILVCEWLKHTLEITWPEEFCLSTPRARFDFLRDDLASLTKKFTIEKSIIEKLSSDLTHA